MVAPNIANAQASVVPVFRRAILVTTKPKLSDKVANELLIRLKELWPRVADDYRRVVARAVDVEPSSLEFKPGEEARIGIEDGTPTIDFPRLATIGEVRFSFDTRICIALCIDDVSSKVWSRVGLPQTSSGEPTQLALGDLGSLIARFRDLATTATEWAYKLLRRVRGDLHIKMKRRPAALEVTTLGTRNDDLSSYFQDLEAGLSPYDLLKNPHAHRTLEAYYGQVISSTADIAELSDESEAIWFSFPVTVDLEDQRIERREVIFFMWPGTRTAEVVGVAPHDDAFRQLAWKVALGVSRWIAKRV